MLRRKRSESEWLVLSDYIKIRYEVMNWELHVGTDGKKKDGSPTITWQTYYYPDLRSCLRRSLDFMFSTDTANILLAIEDAEKTILSKFDKVVRAYKAQEAKKNEGS